MRKLSRAIALFLSVVLLLSWMAVPRAQAADGIFYISDAGDLAELAQKSNYDKWSQDLIVELTNDINLNGAAFTPIPVFSGTFRGNGHTISGLVISGSGDTRGLFRYIQQGATVQDLNLQGTVSPESRQSELGLLAGSNAGRILNCFAGGTVKGETSIGGLVGVNEASGELVNCGFTGGLTGNHAAGGIVGENHGTLTNCKNEGSINTRDLEDAPKTDYPNLEKLNAMENMPAYTDIGGVAGFSDGVIQGCENVGNVGYEQLGYNIGGIAGRQAGWLDGCKNSGAVRGRKDVGGIVGHLEPQIIRTFSEDFLDKLLDQLDSLQNIMDQTVNDADSISDQVHEQMNDISDKTHTVKELTATLIDAMTDWANGNIDQINELSARVSWSLDQLSDILDDAVYMTEDLDRMVIQLERVRKPLAHAVGAGSDAADSLDSATGSLRDANNDVKNTVPGVSNAVAGVAAAIAGGNPDEINAALGNLVNSLGGLNDAMGNVDDALSYTDDVITNLGIVSDDLSKAMRLSKQLNESMSDVVDGLSVVTIGLRDMVQELADQPDIVIAPIGPDITDTGDQLEEAMDSLLDSGDALNVLLSDSADILVADLKSMNQQFRSINNLIRSEKADWDEERGKSIEDQIKAHFQDLSETCDVQKQHDGRISGSENTGEVSGNYNLGGIVGDIGLEIDFDIDEDVNTVGRHSMDFHYQARALVYDCINRGAVTGKNDYIGGVAGRTHMGQIKACENYGTLDTDGSYVGGIAGQVEGSVYDSWSKCELTGEDYVGGVVGYVEDTLVDSHSLAVVNGQAYFGAIAGGMDDESTVTGNTFTHETLGGIDGISYEGKADPVSFDTLCAVKNVPKTFSELELTFRADGKVVAVVPFQYGRGIDSLPAIPQKKGNSAAWPDLDYTYLTASRTLDAIYTPYSSALTEDGEGLPQILVDGSFGPNAEISHTSIPVTWEDERGKEYSGEAYTVTVTDPEMKEISYTVHYRLPDSSKRYTLWVIGENGWEKQDSSVDGSYLLFTNASGTDSITFCVLERGLNLALPIGAAAMVLLAVLGVVYKKKGKEIKERWKKYKARKAVQKARRGK